MNLEPDPVSADAGRVGIVVCIRIAPDFYRVGLERARVGLAGVAGKRDVHVVVVTRERNYGFVHRVGKLAATWAEKDREQSECGRCEA